MRPIAVGALLFVAAASLLAAPDDALGLGGRRHGATATRNPEPPRKAVSVGAPNEGHLEGGAHLETSPELRILPSRAGTDNRWGLPALVGMLERSSRAVDKKFPGAVMTVGDLSRRGGGEVSHHKSHETGRDADVPFYLFADDGKKQWLQPRFVSIDENGVADGNPHVRFDEARNWALVAAWLNDPEASVRQIFVASHLRQRLLEYAARIKAPQSLRNRAALAMLQPRKGLPHDDHFHVRIGCPASQRGTCVEYAYAPKDAKKHGATAKSHPVVAKARKRGGTTATPAPPLVGVVPAPEDDFSPPPDDDSADDPDSGRDVEPLPDGKRGGEGPFSREGGPFGISAGAPGGVRSGGVSGDVRRAVNREGGPSTAARCAGSCSRPAGVRASPAGGSRCSLETD